MRDATLMQEVNVGSEDVPSPPFAYNASGWPQRVPICVLAMVGCAAAKTLVAINRDPDAAVFRYARFGIVGDCLAILPELIRAVKTAKE